MSNLKRNHYCGTLGKADNEKEVVLCGWVAKRRDHGGLIFIDLRDRSGIVQVVVDPDHAGNDFATAEAIRSEYVIKVHGVIRLRSDETINPNLYACAAMKPSTPTLPPAKLKLLPKSLKC